MQHFAQVYKRDILSWTKQNCIVATVKSFSFSLPFISCSLYFYFPLTGCSYRAVTTRSLFSFSLFVFFSFSFECRTAYWLVSHDVSLTLNIFLNELHSIRNRSYLCGQVDLLYWEVMQVIGNYQPFDSVCAATVLPELHLHHLYLLPLQVN